MSWFKDHKFIAALGTGTLIGVALLYFVGAKGSARYNQAKMDFDAAAEEASSIERMALYPLPENRDGKRKAIDEYRKSLDTLQSAFEPFRPKEIKNVSPQDFTNSLKAVNEDVRKAFANSETVVPEAFFCGFENYKTTLARGESTGILAYQLDGIKNIMLALASSGASELKNIYRPTLDEENGNAFKPDASAVARPLSMEITFSGPEKSARLFLSSLTKSTEHYFVIRSLRITNAKKDPPRAADAKFDKPAASSGSSSDAFASFVLPSDEAAAPAANPAGGAPAPAAPAPAPKPQSSDPNPSRVLSQVLGNEQVNVFLRLDLMQFLPAKKLP